MSKTKTEKAKTYIFENKEAPNGTFHAGLVRCKFINGIYSTSDKDLAEELRAGGFNEAT